MDSIHAPKSDEADNAGPSRPRSDAELRSPTPLGSSHIVASTESVTNAGKTPMRRKKTETPVTAFDDSDEEVFAAIDSITEDMFAVPKPSRPGGSKRSLKE